MAPTQQSTTVAANSSEFATNSTASDSMSAVRIEKEHYSSSSSSKNNFHSDTQNINNRLTGAHEETSLPINCRGEFFHDDFFADTRHHFEEAVRNVLNQCGHQASLHNDDLTSYRTLRKSDLTEKSQASTVTEDSTCHKVVIDVQDFKSGDVKVKVVDECEVVVEGSVEQQNGGSVSKKSFRRSFNFPGQIKTDEITSTMSSEGILTVTVPKKVTIPKTTSIDIQESQKQTSNKSVGASNTSPNYVINDDSGSDTHSRQASTLTSSSHTTFKSSLTKDSKENLTTHENNTTKKVDQRNGFLLQPIDLLLPISQSGSFFQDSFFTQAHQEFEEAMRKVLKSEGESVNEDNVVASYRSLRERNLKEDNQAVSITEDNHEHKVVLDVKDFMRGDVKVKVVDEEKIVVEGSVEQEDVGVTSKKTFRRSFIFPGLVKAADITSTMSSDGVLIVTVPKESTKQLSDIKFQESDKTTSMSTETTKKSSSSSSDSKHDISKTHSHQTSTLASTQTTSTNVLTTDSKEKKTSDVNNSTREEHNCKRSTFENGNSIYNLDYVLPISQSDSSFQESFFTQTHQEFEEAMKKVLKSEGESVNKDDVVTSYRSLRERNLKEDNQAVSITEDNHEHKVVMDVREFMDGGVRVKVVDENQLVVESTMEQQNGMSMSKKSFQRSFTFPGLINAEAVTSTLSTDGILTIRILKKKQMNGEVKTTESTNATNQTKDSNVTTGETKSSYSVNSSSNVTEGRTSSSSIDTKESRETEKLMRSKACSSEKEEVESNCSFESTTTNHSHLDGTTNSSSWVLDSLLPVLPKGRFFDDSYFEESRHHFETAVKEAIDKFGHEESVQTDDLSRYWTLRSNDLTSENKAVKVTENEHIHQVVLDVNDFKDGDLKVKVVGKNQVEVEGKVEKQEGGCTSSRTFSKCFYLPGVVDTDAVTSALSSDGILTIKAPKGGSTTTVKGNC